MIWGACWEFAVLCSLVWGYFLLSIRSRAFGPVPMSVTGVWVCVSMSFMNCFASFGSSSYVFAALDSG